MLDSVRADVVFGWRLLWKSKATSAAAVVSLALAMGSCVAAFRIIDALLWRPLPIREPERLHVLYRNGIGPDGRPRSSPSFEYPLFAQMRDTASSMADLVAVSYATRRDITYSTDEETEKAYVQWVSGTMFDRFGVAPALGRVLTANDDLKPGAHPVAAISHDYWKRRFGSDPDVIGRKLRMGATEYELIGVAGRRVHGNGARNDHRHLRPDDDERGRNAAQFVLAADFRALEAGCSAAAIARRCQASLSRVPGGNGEGSSELAEGALAGVPQ